MKAKARAKPKGKSKGGAPKGNANALKHGLHADIKKLRRSKGDLEWLIGYYETILEAMIPVVDALIAKERSKYTAEEITTLDQFHTAADRYANHVKILAYKNGDMNQLEREIEDGIFLARESMNVLDYLNPNAGNKAEPQ